MWVELCQVVEAKDMLQHHKPNKYKPPQQVMPIAEENKKD
jgi:hypothetical protein